MVVLIYSPFLTGQQKPTPQTGREFFEEMRDAGQFAHYSDKYVCFDEDVAKPGFALVSPTEDVAGSRSSVRPVLYHRRYLLRFP